MNKKLIALAGASLLGCMILAGVSIGVGHGVAAAEDDRFKINGTTLTAYLGNDTFVSIPDTVTVIGDGAFEGKETLTGVEIPDSVSTISYNAFKDCTALTNISLSDSIKKVGPGAFEGCTSLEMVEIGENVSSWGTGVFVDCESLARLIVDANNPYLTYYNGALYNGNMTMLYQVLPGREGENYVMPDTVEEIDAYALWNLQNTQNIKVSNAVDTIPTYAFSNMGAVENVVLQETTTTISDRAFADNETLAQVVIPDTVKDIHKGAFSNCPNLKIYTTKGTTAEEFGKSRSIEVIYKAEYPTDFMDSNVNLEEKPNVGSDKNSTTAGNETVIDKTTSTDITITYVEENDAAEEEEQAGTSNFESASDYVHPLDAPEEDNVIGKTVIVAGNAVFLMNNHDGQVYGIPDGVSADVVTEEQAAVQESQSEETAAESESDEEASASDKNKISVTVETNASQNDEAIPQRKYYKQKSLTSYEISETVSTIGRLAFAESGLKEIDIPENVTAIEYGAFMGCTELKTVTIPETVERIGTKAFEGTPWLNNWMNGNRDSEAGDFLIVGDGILLAYRGTDEHVTIPDGVKQIGSEVFKGHTEVVDVYIPASVTKICAEAFRNCSSLTGLSGCENLRTVIRGAFYGTQISEDDF